MAADLQAEASKHAIEGWDSILQAHLGPAGATLVWTTFWVAHVVLLMVFTRYVGVLGAGAAAKGTPERLAYDRLRASLEEGGSPTRVYGRLLTQFLDGVDRFFGDRDKADLGIFRHAFGLRGSYPLWTGAALDRCLLLSLVYPIVSVIVIWAISGHVGLAEVILSLPSNASGWARGACLAGIFGLSVSMWKAIKSLSAVWGYIGMAAMGIALVSGGGSFDTVMALAFIAAILVALTAMFGTTVGAVPVAGVVAFIGAGLVTSVFPAVFSVFPAVFAFVGVICFLVFWLSGFWARRRHQGAFLAAYGVVVLVIITSIARSIGGDESLWLFLGLLSLLNAPFNWLSVGLTRALLRRGVELRGWWPYVLAAVDAVLSSATLVVLAGAMVIGVQAFDLATHGGGNTLPLGSLFDTIASRPSDPVNWWVYALLLATLIPSVTNLLIGSMSLTRGVPGVSVLLLRSMPVGVAVPAFDRTWIAVVLTLQWAIGLAFMLAAFALLGWLVSIFVPEVGTLFLNYARAIADVNLPRQAWPGIGR